MGPPNALGHRIPIDNAEDHIFGVVLMNDWSGLFDCLIFFYIQF